MSTSTRDPERPDEEDVLDGLRRSREELGKFFEEGHKLQAEREKRIVEYEKLQLERLRREHGFWWRQWLVITGAYGTAIAVAIIVLKVLSVI